MVVRAAQAPAIQRQRRFKGGGLVLSIDHGRSFYKSFFLLLHFSPFRDDYDGYAGCSLYHLGIGN